MLTVIMQNFIYIDSARRNVRILQFKLKLKIQLQESHELNDNNQPLKREYGQMNSDRLDKNTVELIQTPNIVN